jgi:hypothetical protein
MEKLEKCRAVVRVRTGSQHAALVCHFAGCELKDQGAIIIGKHLGGAIKSEITQSARLELLDVCPNFLNLNEVPSSKYLPSGLR